MQIANTIIGVVNLVLTGILVGKIINDETAARDAEKLEKENAELLFEVKTGENYSEVDE